MCEMFEAFFQKELFPTYSVAGCKRASIFRAVESLEYANLFIGRFSEFLFSPA